ncbi:MAG: hypothetical protein ACQSGP_13930, partial [Frankia sp.]
HCSRCPYLYLSVWGMQSCSTGCTSLAPGWLTTLAGWLGGGSIFWLYIVTGIPLLALSLLLNPNANSLHQLYRDRLSKAFLFDPNRRETARALPWLKPDTGAESDAPDGGDDRADLGWATSPAVPSQAIDPDLRGPSSPGSPFGRIDASGRPGRDPSVLITELTAKLRRQEADSAQEKADLAARLATAEQQAAESERRVGSAEQQAAEAERRVARAQAQADAWAASASRDDDEKREAERLRAQLADAEGRAAKFSSRLAMARTEAEDSQRQVATTTTRLDRHQAEWAAERVRLLGRIAEAEERAARGGPHPTAQSDGDERSRDGGDPPHAGGPEVGAHPVDAPDLGPYDDDRYHVGTYDIDVDRIDAADGDGEPSDGGGEPSAHAGRRSEGVFVPPPGGLSWDQTFLTAMSRSAPGPVPSVIADRPDDLQTRVDGGGAAGHDGAVSTNGTGANGHPGGNGNGNGNGSRGVSGNGGANGHGGINGHGGTNGTGSTNGTASRNRNGSTNGNGHEPVTASGPGGLNGGTNGAAVRTDDGRRSGHVPSFDQIAAGASPSGRSRARPDNLREIVGIGPIIEGRLRARGITTFEQMATLDPDEGETILDELETTGSINIEDWISQARHLHTRKQG